MPFSIPTARSCHEPRNSSTQSSPMRRKASLPACKVPSKRQRNPITIVDLLCQETMSIDDSAHDCDRPQLVFRTPRVMKPRYPRLGDPETMISPDSTASAACTPRLPETPLSPDTQSCNAKVIQSSLPSDMRANVKWVDDTRPQKLKNALHVAYECTDLVCSGTLQSMGWLDALEMACIITAKAYDDVPHNIEPYLIGAAAAMLAYKNEYGDHSMTSLQIGKMLQILGFGGEHDAEWLGKSIGHVEWWLFEIMQWTLRVPTMIGTATVAAIDIMMQRENMYQKFNDLVIMSYGISTPKTTMNRLIQQDNRAVILACICLCPEDLDAGEELAEKAAEMLGVREFKWNGIRKFETTTRAVADALQAAIDTSGVLSTEKK